MDKALERALDHAEGVIESAQQRPPKRKHSSSGGQSLHEKLYDIYVEECGKEPEVTEELTSNVNLLEKLVSREPLPCLVVNLYPGQKGYSLMIKGLDEEYSETIRLPYEEKEFLEYLDAEELPPILMDILEQSQVNLFHRGCVIAEIRDYRQCSHGEPPGYQSRHILLRPTMQTLACDVHSITSDHQEWTQEDKLLLESQLILATAEPLCLDPSVSVACIENRLLYHKQKMNTVAMRRNFQRYSTASLNRRQRELSCGPPPPELRAQAPDQKRKENQAGQQSDLPISKPGDCVDMWKEQPCALEVPSALDVEKWAEEERPVKHDSQPTVWPAQEVKEGSLFGCQAGDQSQTTKPSPMQSLNDPFISGKRSRKKVRCGREMSHHRSSTDEHYSSFMPGSKTDAGKAASQSEDLVQKNAKSPVTVSLGCSGSASLSQLSSGKEAEQPLALSVPSSVLGKGVQHTPPPISLSSSSGNSSSGNSFTAQTASSFRESPFPTPASKPPSLPQKASVEVNQVSTLPEATQPTASSSQTTPASHVKANSAGPNVIKVVGPVHAAQTGVRGSNPVKGSTAKAKAPVAIKPRIIYSGGQQLPNTWSTVPKAPSQGVHLILKNASDPTHITLLQLPPGSLILNTQQQPQQQPQQPQQQLPQQLQQQQPQQQQPQQFYRLIPPPQLQQPVSHIQQPVSKGSSAKGSTRQRIILPAPQPAVINSNEIGSVLQPQRMVMSQPSSTQTRPGQSPPQQSIQLPSAFQQLQQPQQVQVRILQLPVTVPTIETQTAQPHRAQQTASGSKGKTNRGPPTTPKS